MKKSTIASLATAFALLSAPAMASDNTVFGMSSHYFMQDIQSLGFNVVGVEEWGRYVVATVADENGHLSFKYFDPDTRRLVR